MAFSFKDKLKQLKKKKLAQPEEETAAAVEPVREDTHEDRTRRLLEASGPSIMQQAEAEVLSMPGACVIALLFMVREGLPFERMWRKWIAAAKASGLEVIVVVHSHHPEKITSKWVSRRLLGQRFNTTWGSLELVRAAVALLVSALQRKTKEGHSAQRFLFASESCLPVHAPAETRSAFFGDEGAPCAPRSWLRARNRPNNGYSGQLQFDPISVAIPKVGRRL